MGATSDRGVDATSDPWVVRPLEAPDGTVAAEMAGAQVGAWSTDAELSDAPEAWPTAFCLPAARAEVALEVPERVDRTWAAGADANVALAASWWGGADHLRLVEPASASTRRSRWRRRPDRRAPQGPVAGRALCFTGGVDSFFSLLAGAHNPTHLLYVVGFDIDLDDQERIDAATTSLRLVADAVDVQPLVVGTDLRSHPSFASVSWEHTHGAALATVAHLLHPTIGTLVIPPSYAASRLVPWGSRPDLDPRWSVPGRTRIVHGDASGRRLDRVLAIASSPLVHRHLRVCWQNVPGSLNCGRCEKCLRTMVMLAGADQLQRCETFPDRGDLPGALDALEALAPGVLPMWQDLADLPLRPAERKALHALLARSG